MIKANDVIVPLDVPRALRENHINNYLEITRKTVRLMLFAGDQKVEHLNDDFYGEGIHPDDSSPEHLFRIASQAEIGVFATQLGLIARYGMHYPDVPYQVILNSKTNLVTTPQSDPFSQQWLDVQQVDDFRNNSELNILAVGRTKVICAGGSSVDVESFLKRLHEQIHVSGAAGNATGRNIHQKSLEDAIRMCNAIYAITVEDASVAEALEIYYAK